MQKFKTKVKEAIQANASPPSLARSFTFGIVGALFPIPASTTVLCTLFAWVFQLNMPVVMLMNFGLLPVQLALIVPFAWLGSTVSGVELPAVTVDAIMGTMESDGFRGLLGKFGVPLGMAIVGWSLASLVLGIPMYMIWLRVVASVKKSQGAAK
uniref:DUF2062 domain-containing protein n=1 Tax=Eutreptiella gymnastica TaxID=73025 RepID=A0A7S1NGS6_9EUGL|mmetsp:Transcript_33421/g.59916  ORF Transcript_33421/g.59916 Transcript_33421/m.59916 type:complete len:154 (+) Transcript_33421:45-506(+)